LDVTFGLALLTLLLTPVRTPAADSAAVIPLFSSQKSVATGTAISGRSTNGIGIYGFTEDGIGVFGRDDGTTQGRGYGGFFSSNTGIGVAGRSTAVPTTQNNFVPGVYGFSKNGNGVYGFSDSTSGIYGGSDTDYAGQFSGLKGIRAYADGTVLDDAYAGNFYSENYRGIYAASGANYYAAYFKSPSGIYVEGGGIHVEGNISADGSKTGYVVDLALNDGSAPLETGDLVVITGSGEPILGEIPLIHVRKCATMQSSAIAGVVDKPYILKTIIQEGKNGEPIEKSIPVAGTASSDAPGNTSIAPGEYLSVVTLGSFKTIKADATGGPIAPGDLLVSSSTPGYAMRAGEDPPAGAVIGKALRALDSGTGLIPILVTLR